MCDHGTTDESAREKLCKQCDDSDRSEKRRQHWSQKMKQPKIPNSYNGGEESVCKQKKG